MRSPAVRAAVEPQVVVPFVVAAAMLIGGAAGAAVAGMLGALYTFFYYDQAARVNAPGSLIRVVLTVLASAAFVWLIGWLHERLTAARAAEAVHAAQRERQLAFAGRLAEEPPEALPDALVLGAATPLAAEMAVLTILDPASGRHMVRAVHGTDSSAIGVEVLPGVGITGQAIREQRLLLSGATNEPGNVAWWRRRLAGRSMTGPQPQVALIMFDVDDFRVINERHGRQVGDHVLRAVATLLRQRFRASDIVARVGADSFVVVLNGASAEVASDAAAQVASDAAAQVRRQVRDLNVTGARGERVPVSISAGCALLRDTDRSDVIFRSVEAALATARWSGPGAVVSI